MARHRSAPSDTCYRRRALLASLAAALLIGPACSKRGGDDRRDEAEAARAAPSPIDESGLVRGAPRPEAERDGGAQASAAAPEGGAVGASAFANYVQRSKAAEARQYLERIVQGAEVYLAHERVGRDLAPLPCAFPPSTDLTPPGSPCDHADQRYPGRADDWESETWRALHFAITDPHRFRYQFSSEGTGDGASFVATAHADLDCDGVWSTFQRIGRGAVDPETGACALSGRPELVVEREGE